MALPLTANDTPQSQLPEVRWAGFDEGRPMLSLEGPAGVPLTVQVSTDLQLWSDADALQILQSPLLWTDTEPFESGQRFYRVALREDLPAGAENPWPPDQDTGVVNSPQLEWSGGSDVQSYTVRFGTDWPAPVVTDLTASTFNPGTLAPNTTYYWQVDAHGPEGVRPGAVWSFSTAPRPSGVTYVGAGPAASGTTPVTLGLPAGLEPGDILILFLQTAGPHTYVADVNGGTWLSLARDTASPRSTGSGSNAVHLTAYYSRFNGTQGAPTTNHSGSHQLGQIVAFRGVVGRGVPWDAASGNTRSDVTTSTFTPGATPTVPNTLVVGAIATAAPATDRTDLFSGWTSNLGVITHLTERVDVATSAGTGGGLGVVTGNFNGPGTTYGRINATLAVPSTQAMLSVALRPEVGPAQIGAAWPENGAQHVGLTARLRWDPAYTATSRVVYFGTTAPGELRGSQTGSTFDPGPLEPNTTYFWRVDEKNAAGTTTGVVRQFTTGTAAGVPGVTGMMLADAERELERAGLLAGTVIREFHPTAAPGVVLAQDPPPGADLAPGSTVDLVRSRGPEEGVMVFPNGPDFLGGEAIPVHRNVALVTTQAGTLLAFTGHRVNGASDEDDHDIHLRRSTDGGETWGPVIVIADDGMNPCKNMVPVVLPSGRILMPWLWNEWIPSEDDRQTREVYVTYSDDDGLTWAPHRNITSSVYGPDWRWYGLGPGQGFVKKRAPHAGRIIFPGRHGRRGFPSTAHIIYSDDGGETFHLGGSLEPGNESIAVEKSNGDIMMNVRLGSGDFRFVGLSTDGGMSFPVSYYDTQLLAAGACQASMLEHSMNPVTGRANILFSNPNDKYERINGTIKLSENDGDPGTWVRQFRYSPPAPAFSGYSDITVINAAGDIGILWEYGSHFSKPARWDGGVHFRPIRFDQISDPVPPPE